MLYNPEIHHRRSIRLNNFDYTATGAYFVTICAFDRECLFGGISNGEMTLNEFGHIVHGCWMETTDHFPNTVMDVFVVMPNHVHGIIFIRMFDKMTVSEGTTCRAPTFESFGAPVAGSMATIVRSFKSAATKRINQIRNNPGTTVWQRGFFEHVIRNEKELNTIRCYIEENPTNWCQDTNNPANP